MPNAKLVRASDVKDLLMGLYELPWEENVGDLVDSLPTIDATSVVQKHGKWKYKFYHGIQYRFCSNCNHRNGLDLPFNYCPNCGAKMGGDSDAT